MFPLYPAASLLAIVLAQLLRVHNMSYRASLGNCRYSDTDSDRTVDGGYIDEAEREAWTKRLLRLLCPEAPSQPDGATPPSPIAAAEHRPAETFLSC